MIQFYHNNLDSLLMSKLFQDHRINFYQMDLFSQTHKIITFPLKIYHSVEMYSNRTAISNMLTAQTINKMKIAKSFQYIKIVWWTLNNA